MRALGKESWTWGYLIAAVACSACGGSATSDTTANPATSTAGSSGTGSQSSAGTTGAQDSPAAPGTVPAGACDGPAPADGSPCYEPLDILPYVCRFQLSCTTIEAQCQSGTWHVPKGYCAPPPCPAKLPSDGAACDLPSGQSPYQCSYPDRCAYLTATCVGTWELSEGVPVCPGENGGTGGIGQAGATSTSGDAGAGGQAGWSAGGAVD